MEHSKTVARIVSCQGGIQLVAALSAMTTRQSELEHAGYRHQYEDILVIYDLYAPGGQSKQFASFIEKMAVAIWSWKAVIYLTPPQLTELDSALDVANLATVCDQVRDLIGLTAADEIYLCRNWQLGNRLLMNAYLDATKICYGDAVGIYFSEEYFSPASGSNGSGATALMGVLRQLKKSVRTKLGHVEEPVTRTKSNYQLLPEIDFEIGYFLLPEILNQQPPMETRLVAAATAERIFRELATSLHNEGIRRKYEYIGRVPTVVLMTSNFSEAARMSRENEIAAYRVFMKRSNFDPKSVLVIKPHPRDSDDKISEVGSALSDLFADVVLMTEPELFFLPFEVFLMQSLEGDGENNLKRMRTVTFSTACLSLEVLFHLGPLIGFGDDLVRKFFYPDYAAGRIKHEHDLRLAVQQLSEHRQPDYEVGC